MSFTMPATAFVEHCYGPCHPPVPLLGVAPGAEDPQDGIAARRAISPGSPSPRRIYGSNLTTYLIIPEPSSVVTTELSTL